MNIDKKIVDDLVANDISFVTTVPCKQLAGVIDEVERRDEVFHIPSNKEDEGMGLCAGAWMGGETSGDHHAEHGDWGDHQYPGHAHSILSDATADADLLSR